MNSNGPMTNGRPAIGGRSPLRRGSSGLRGAEDLARRTPSEMHRAEARSARQVQPSRAIARRYLLSSRISSAE